MRRPALTVAGLGLLLGALFVAVLAGCVALSSGCVALASGAREDSDARVPVILPPPDAPTPLSGEPERGPEPEPGSGPRRASRGALPVAAGQVWIGQYSCAGAPADVTIRFESVDGTRVRGVVERTAGRWAFEGSYDPPSGALELTPTRWLQEIPGASMVGLYGTVSDDVYEGRVTDPTCRWFTLRRAA